ncbi:MAG: universal stress protein [Vicinamibacterales bacterium]
MSPALAADTAALPASILCAVDFSAHAERALRYALALTAARGGHLTIVAVTDPLLASAAAAAGRGETVHAQVEEALTALLARLPRTTPPVMPAIDTVTGDAATEILAAAGRAGAGLVVLGTQGLGGASKLVFGSTAERVIRDASLPVLVVPTHEPERVDLSAVPPAVAFGHVVAAVGFDRHDAAVVAAATAWAQAGTAGLTLGHVCAEAPLPVWWPLTEMPLPPALEESTDAARQHLETLAQPLPLRAAVDVRRGAVARTVAAMVRDVGAGLLVVSRGGTSHRVGTIAYRVMREADVPTLVVAAPA